MVDPGSNKTSINYRCKLIRSFWVRSQIPNKRSNAQALTISSEGEKMQLRQALKTPKVKRKNQVRTQW
jgi:hypothetical protein